MFRDSSGRFIRAFATGHTTASRAELQSVFIGLKQAGLLDIKKLILEVESLVVLGWLSGDASQHCQFQGTIRLCKRLLNL